MLGTPDPVEGAGGGMWLPKLAERKEDRPRIANNGAGYFLSPAGKNKTWNFVIDGEVDMAKSSFDKWLEGAQPGEQYIYHAGEKLSDDGIEFTDEVWDAREAFDRGEIDMAQRRIEKGRTVRSPGKFAWIAVKRAVVRKPEEWISKEGDVVRWPRRPKIIPQRLAA